MQKALLWARTDTVTSRNVRRRRRGRLAAVFAALSLTTLSANLQAQPAHAFGTLNSDVLGQTSEHERITRRALQCGVTGNDDATFSSDCFEPKSLDIIAGTSTTHSGVAVDPSVFGAVGWPDNPVNGDSLKAEAHCDNADYLPTPGYPHSTSAANGAIINCIQKAWDRKSQSLYHAALVVSFDEAFYDPSRLSPPQITVANGCNFYTVIPPRGSSTDSAKCDALQLFGMSLHTVQDFFAHSNYTDQGGSNTIANPPGLGMSPTGNVPLLDLRGAKPTSFAIPEGLITGCFGDGCTNRVTHDVMNKDEGVIPTDTRLSIGTGNTPRGRVNGNFQHAVEAAVAQTKTQWENYKRELKSTYGNQRGSMIACVMTHDDPAHSCYTEAGGFHVWGGGTNWFTVNKEVPAPHELGEYDINKMLATAATQNGMKAFTAHFYTYSNRHGPMKTVNGKPAPPTALANMFGLVLNNIKTWEAKTLGTHKYDCVQGTAKETPQPPFPATPAEMPSWDGPESWDAATTPVNTMWVVKCSLATS